MINKNIAPVQGRIATLVTSTKRSRHEKAFDNFSKLGPCECAHSVGIVVPEFSCNTLWIPLNTRMQPTSVMAP